MRLDRRNLLAGAGAVLLSPMRPGRADTFPARPLTLIVPLAAGFFSRRDPAGTRSRG